MEEKLLDELGFPDYKINTNGEVYSFQFLKCISYKDTIKIRELYKTGLYKQKDLAKIFNICYGTINKILNKNCIDWFLMTPSLDDVNRPRVTLCNPRGNIKYKRYKICTLVALIFIGPKPKNKECCHNDGNSKNNKLSNLRYGTKKENAEDRIKHKTNAQGEKNGGAKLSEIDILNIKYLYRFLSQKEIAKIYKIHAKTIGNIINRKTWKHLEENND